MTPDASISRSVLSEQVKDRLLRDILDGRYPPGARIVETRVARELGTSQAPVREALRDLEALGVIEVTAFRGACVRHPSAAELVEAFAVRSELESLAARLALPRVTDEDLQVLAGYLGEMQRAAGAGDAHTLAAADAAFHGTIVVLSGNRTLERVWRTLEPFSRTYVTVVAPGVDQRYIADAHVAILDVLRTRDPDAAVEALRRHFDNAAAILDARWDGPAMPVRPSGDGVPLPSAAAAPSAT
ncbi:MAG TPA: GntR family transcriptional regulator [Candidatus Dormibacteraeota bacterium]|nr:GntR family transcriptional regulator [Candidatus Dormibacteraeota bacterium]